MELRVSGYHSPHVSSALYTWRDAVVCVKPTKLAFPPSGVGQEAHLVRIISGRARLGWHL